MTYRQLNSCMAASLSRSQQEIEMKCMQLTMKLCVTPRDSLQTQLALTWVPLWMLLVCSKLSLQLWPQCGKYMQPS